MAAGETTAIGLATVYVKTDSPICTISPS